jgi:hypothetical protein
MRGGGTKAHKRAMRSIGVSTTASVPSRQGFLNATLSRPSGSSLRAALACAEGDRAGAIAALEAHLESAHGHAAGAARRRLGVLVGGSDGDTLVEQADAELREIGAKDPERFAAVLLPGCKLVE